MTHLAFQKSGRTLEIDADVVVVGSGAGGAAAAVTLARGGHSVIVVEAGPWLDPEHYPGSCAGAMKWLFDDWGVQVTRGRALWPVVQARAVGGTTVINSAICVRTPGDIFMSWRTEHGIDDAQLADRVWRHQDQIEKELSAELVPKTSLGRSNELAILGAERRGFEGHVMRRYAEGCQGQGQCLQGCRAGRKQSTNLNYIPEVLERGGTVVSCAPVKRVLIENGRATGVVGRFRHPGTKAVGDRYVLRARRAVFLAASATHTPALLERSGYRSPALGQHFRSHPGTGVFGLYDDPVDMQIGATQGWASMAYRENPGLKLETLALPLEMVASRLAGGGTQLMERLTNFRHLSFWIQAVRAEASGTVRNGFGGRPVVRYQLGPVDMQKMKTGIRILAEMQFAAGAKKVWPGVFGLPFEIGPDELGVLDQAPLDPRAYTAILSHLFGGAVMGSDPKRAVCDTRARVYGVPNLVIADASAIPTTLGVNPQHTIMGLAQLRAEELLNEESRAHLETPARASRPKHEVR